MSPREINRLHIRVMSSVRRKVAMEIQGIALVGIACTAGDKDSNLPGWLEKMGAPPVIKKLQVTSESADEFFDDDAEKEAVAAAIEIARRHMASAARPAEITPGMVD